MLFFQRDVEAYISTVSTGHTTDNTVKINILSGSSIDYSTKIQDTYEYKISNSPNRLNEKVILGSTAPILRFITYPKPYKNTNVTSVEKLLLYSLTGSLGTETINDYTTQFISTNKLPELFIFIKFGSLIYKISNSVVKSAELKFDIGEILTISWELVGLSVQTVTTVPTIYTDYTAIGNYIKSNFTTIVTDVGTLPAISGTFKFINAVEIAERNTLNIRAIQYLDHYVKQRDIELDFIGYLKTGVVDNKSLFDNINNNIGYNDTNTIQTIVTIGRQSEANIVITLPKSHIDLPQIKIQDIISSNIKITARRNTVDNDDTTIKYII